ncbi:UPF0481 protein At3g47200-like [Carya illinoinensis]|uniref:Uncharacterized protein n=1 Tax=Carya illinoinensis TaxID=32201 RepID=A0A8T1NDX5_CARIL|nr:UPF0481 protein At3g47200-like [Carya illinoinensis]KAG6628575.1 hypothetical protein CIPAW_14G022700 [Carya illinoinensis]
MEQTFVYTTVHPDDKLRNDKHKLIEWKGLFINSANHSKKKNRKFECKELIIDIDQPALEASHCPDNYCIYKVPKRLRKVNNIAYTPRLVSIGPFHHRSEVLKDMDIQKLLILKNFCVNNDIKSIEVLKSIIRPKEEKIRSCYSETILLSSEGFLNMILLDAIFILELFRKKSEKDSRSSKARKEDSESSKAHKEDSENSKAHEKDFENSKADQIDYILSRPWLECGILHDLLLLENQLPFFVLEDLYQKGEPSKDKQSDLLKLSCSFFGDLIYYVYGSKPNSKTCGDRVKQPFIDGLVKYLYPEAPQKKVEIKHLTDLVRRFFYPPKTEGQKLNRCSTCLRKIKPSCCCSPGQEQEEENKRNNKHLRGTATKLDEAGLKFTRPGSKTDLLQIQFPENECLETFPCFNLSWLLSCLPCLKSNCLERRVQRCLEVPPLLLDDKTEGLFRNLMALEQCHYPSETYICDYIVLLDDLITTKEDVRFLVEKEIIVNELGSSAAVTKLINNLALEIEESGNPDYETLCEKVNDYYKSPWNRLVGILTGTYFSDFFKGTATVVGIIILVLTLWNFQRLVRLSARKYYI